MRLNSLLALVVLLGASCGLQSDGNESPGMSGPTAGSPEYRALLGGDICRRDLDCITGICSEGTCIGFLMISSDAGRNDVGDLVRQKFGKSPASVSRLAAIASGMADDPLTEVYFRGRSVDFFRFLPCAVSLPVLKDKLASRDEPVRFFAARALALCGDSRGREVLGEFSSHPSEAIRRMASAVQ